MFALTLADSDERHRAKPEQEAVGTFLDTELTSKLCSAVLACGMPRFSTLGELRRLFHRGDLKHRYLHHYS